MGLPAASQLLGDRALVSMASLLHLTLIRAPLIAASHAGLLAAMHRVHGARAVCLKWELAAQCMHNCSHSVRATARCTGK